MSTDGASNRTGAATSTTLLADHAPSDRVAFGALGERTARQLVDDASRIAESLPPATPDSHIELVFDGDRYALAATLIAALDRGHAVALPPNTRPESILALEARPEVVLIAHDLDSGRGLDVRALLGPTQAADGRRDGDGQEIGALTRRFDADRHVATVFTSGTSGPMAAWPKTARQLIGEAHGLRRTIGIDRGAKIVPTVSPGHIYGLLFGVLLPLSCGGAFLRETPLHAESIARSLAEHEATVLVSVPVQLRALAGSPNIDLSGLTRVVSSTGPLPDSVANAFHARHGRSITEVIGSTETGGFATRLRGEGPAGPFTPFPEATVSVDGDGRLCVESPYVDRKPDVRPGDAAAPFVTGDLAELLADGRFVHHGRADGIVKIAGHRVSLQQVEAALRERPEIEDAAAVAVPDDRGRGHRLLVALAPASIDPASVRGLLTDRLEAAALPRRILTCEALPREANGKLQRRRLLQLFDLDEAGHPANYALEWEAPERERDDATDVFRRRVHLPDDYAWFEGHFEGYPVLAGAAQLKALLVPAIEDAYPDLGPLRRLTRLRWNDRILPGDTLDIRLERRFDDRVVRCTIERDGRTCTAGTLRFDERGAGEAGGAAR